MIKLNKEINRILTWIIIAVNILAFINDHDKSFVFFLKLLNFPLFLFLAIRFYTSNQKTLFFMSLLFVIIYNPLHSLGADNEMGLLVAIFLIGYFILSQSKHAPAYRKRIHRTLLYIHANKEIMSRYLFGVLFIIFIAKCFYIAFYTR